VDIKEPRFDRPIGLGATGETKPVDPTKAEIRPGTKVILVYRAKHVTVHVTDIVKPDTVFIGRIGAFEQGAPAHGDLKSEDLVRFRKADVRWID
jgi:hypothetical protein